MPRHSSLIALILAGVCTLATGCIEPAWAQNGEASLPDIGSSAGRVITPEEQREYGEMTFRELRKEGLVLEDPLLEDWIQGIGDHLGAYSNKPSQDFHVFVVKSRDVNAFATLGGYVAVNAGLILLTTSEDELAGVMSHEFAHVTQNHVLRAYEAQKQATIPIVLAMLAAVALSSHSSSESAGNATEAAMASGLGLIAQTQINFTRDNETEADHFGIQTLARAGYDPLAMASFFGRMQAAYRSDENYGPYKTPDFLMDHPVTTERISDALDRARQIKSKPQTTVTADATNAPASLLLPSGFGDHSIKAAATPELGRDFGWARERLRVFSAESSGAAIAEYQRLRNADPKSFGDAQHYGLAIAMIEHGEAGAALPELKALSERHPDAYWLDLAVARAQFASGQRAVALATYDHVLAKMPGNRAVILSYADTLGQIGTADSGRRAQVILRPLLDASGDDPEFQQTFARACELAGDTGRAGESYAVAAFLNGRAEDALNQLEALKRRDDLGYYERARVEARIEEFKPVVLEMHKQGVHAGDADKRQQMTVRAGLH
ncbi:MAG TPA: M48 family metalloprotease [Xanthomonadaceae bacterium]